MRNVSRDIVLGALAIPVVWTMFSFTMFRGFVGCLTSGYPQHDTVISQDRQGFRPNVKSLFPFEMGTLDFLAQHNAGEGLNTIFPDRVPPEISGVTSQFCEHEIRIEPTQY